MWGAECHHHLFAVNVTMTNVQCRTDKETSEYALLAILTATAVNSSRFLPSVHCQCEAGACGPLLSTHLLSTYLSIVRVFYLGLALGHELHSARICEQHLQIKSCTLGLADVIVPVFLTLLRKTVYIFVSEFVGVGIILSLLLFSPCRLS